LKPGWRSGDGARSARRLRTSEQLEIEELARGVNQGHGVKAPPTPDYLLADPQSYIIRHFDWERLSAATMRVEPGLWLVCLNKNHSKVRQRFSLAHEHWHILQNEAMAFQLDALDERRANHFAASLLMPSDWIFYFWEAYKGDLRRLCSRFKVSRQAMEVRLKELGLAVQGGSSIGRRADK